MSSLAKGLPAWIVVVATMFGCAHSSTCRHPVPPANDVEFALPVVERSEIVGEIADEPPALIAESSSVAPHTYRALTAAEAQCLAVAASSLGNLLDGERRACQSSQLVRHHSCAQQVQLEVLRHAGADARNKSAADALKVYYGLAETEAGLNTTSAALAELDDVQAKTGQLRGRELTVPFDGSQFDRQRSALIAKRADLEATRATLNSKLRTLVGFDHPPEAARLWPSEPIRVVDLALDVESEVAYGLATRPELAALRRLTTVDEEDTKAAAEALLGDAHGLMGVAGRSLTRAMLNSLLGVKGKEACVRRAQIRQLYEDRARQTAGDIRAACEAIDARRRQTLALRGQVESRLRRIDELTQRHETAQASFVELAEARLKLIDERAAVTSAAIAWKRAVVELRELQGALVAECRGCPVPAGPNLSPAEEVPTIEPLPPLDPAAIDVEALGLDSTDV